MKTWPSILQRLHDSEINAGIQSFWDRNWQAWLGDDLNGKHFIHDMESMEECEKELSELAIKMYPESKFAKEFEAKWLQ